MKFSGTVTAATLCSARAMSTSALPKQLFPLRTRGAILPGDSTTAFADITIPSLKAGEVLLQVKASTICGSDIRCIYKEHLGKGAEGYQAGLVAGHEPAGIVVATSESGTKHFKIGDRALVYHVSGCGMCNDCRRGYMNSCTSSLRKAYGWQRHGGMAPFMAVEEKDLIALPEQLTFIDGAIVACSMGTTYEALSKLKVSGDDQVLVVGLGPVGMCAAMLAKAMGASSVVGIDTEESRCKLAAKFCTSVLKVHDSVLPDVLHLSDKGQGFEKVIDCSGSNAGRLLGIRATRKWGSMVLVGEGGPMAMPNVSDELIHDQKTLVGSWVSSTWRMQELVEKLVRWQIHPEALVTHRYALADVGEAYRTMAGGASGKVAVVFDD